MTQIKNPNRTKWANSNEVVQQPRSIDYDQLVERLANVDVKKPLDLRKSSSKMPELLKDDTLNEIEKQSLIPIPGFGENTFENDESTWQPSSEWQTSKGPQWSSMTQ